MSQCPCCASRNKNHLSGRYDMHCVRCCARLVRSAQPLTEAQKAMFASIARHEGAPSQEEIIEEIRLIDQQGKEGVTA